MVDFLLKEVEDGVRASGVELDLVPELFVEVVFDAEEVILVDVLPHELVGEGAVEFEVGLFGGQPELRVAGKGVEQH